jgi:hypothetical protein
MNSLKKFKTLKIPLLMSVLVILISYLIIKMFRTKNKEGFAELSDFTAGTEYQQSAKVQTIAGVAYDTATQEGKLYTELPTNFVQLCDSVENLEQLESKENFKVRLKANSWVTEEGDDRQKLDFDDSSVTVSFFVGENIAGMYDYDYTIIEFDSNSSWVKLQLEFNRSATADAYVSELNLGNESSFMWPFTVGDDGVPRDSSTHTKEVPQKLFDANLGAMILNHGVDINNSFEINGESLKTLYETYILALPSALNTSTLIVTIKDNQLISYYGDGSYLYVLDAVTT